MASRSGRPARAAIIGLARAMTQIEEQSDMIFSRSVLALSVAALVAGPAASAFAQTDVQPQPAAPMEAPATEAPATMEAPAAPAASIDDAKIESFVVAFLQVDEINRSYAPQLQAAGSEEEQQEVRQQAGEAMVQAVESAQGITVEEYNTIIETAQTDPGLAQQINEKIRAAAQ
jgi:hypothetical protein